MIVVHNEEPPGALDLVHSNKNISVKKTFFPFKENISDSYPKKPNFLKQKPIFYVKKEFLIILKKIRFSKQKNSYSCAKKMGVLCLF